MDIKEVQLNDSVLVEAISALIDTTFVSVGEAPFDANISPFEQGKGYVELKVWNNQPGDILTKYQVTPTLNTVEADHSDSVYPQFFAYIKDRIILIYCMTCLNETQIGNTLSEESKVAFRERLEPFLVPTVKIKSPGKDGLLFDEDFRVQYYFIKPAFEILVHRSGEYVINFEPH
ncbi:hypothetical protein GCM10027454_13390 [Algoriphagus aestuariicola]